MRIKATVNLTDIVFILFLIITLILIVAGSDKTEHFYLLVTSRIFAVIIASSLILLDEKISSKTISLLRLFYPLIFSAYFYGETGYYNNIFFENLDQMFINIEEQIFNSQPSLIFSSNFNMLWFSELMNFSYFSFYILVAAIPLILYFKANKNFNKYYFILIFSFYSYYLFFAIFPVIGPQFYFPLELRVLPDSGVFHNIMLFIQEKGETPTGAFPSSHIGITWLIVFLIYKTYPKLLYLVLIFAILISFSTVYLKAHYLVDVMAGLISAPLLYALAKKIFNKFQYKHLLNFSKQLT